MDHSIGNSDSESRRGRIPVGRLFVLLLMIVFAVCHSQDCCASCGDWLEDAGNQADSAAPMPADDHGPPASAPCDCQGPMCEDGTPGNDPLPAPDVELNPHRDLATLRERANCRSQNQTWNQLRDRAAERDGFPATIDRPPRLS